MVRVRSFILAATAGVFLLGLAGCPSPFLARIKDEVARAPYVGATYTFERQWGNAHPEWAFSNPVVRTDQAGHIYVADSTFRIRNFLADGSLKSTIAGFSTRGTEANIYDMAFDAAGNMYLTTNSASKLQKYSSQGSLLHQWGSASDAYGTDAIVEAHGIALDTSGSIYVVDKTHNRVVRFNSSFAFVTEWGGATTYGGLALNGPTGIAVDDSDGYVFILDTANGRVVRTDMVGGSALTFGGTGVLYPAGTGLALSNPKGIAYGKIGSTPYVFVTDWDNDRVVQFDLSGNYQQTWGSAATMDQPETIAVDSSGNVFIAQGDSNALSGTVWQYSVTGTPTLTTTWGGSLGTADGVTATPWGIALEPDGSIGVMEMFNSRVERFSWDGTLLGHIAVPGAFGTGLAVDAAGNSYIADIGNSRYVVYDSAGTLKQSVGSSGSSPGQFDIAIGVVLDSAGNVYVADADNSRVQVFSPDGFYQRSIGSYGTGDGQFESGGDYGVAIDPAGYLYVSDYILNRVQKFTLDGTFVSIIGGPGSGNGQFSAPIGLTVDPAGNLYVCDMMNHRVQKFDSSGSFLTTFGSVGTGSGTFGWPVGIVAGADGRLAVTDYASHLVQVFAPTY
jgi:tripartite motif-containing protein 71